MLVTGIERQKNHPGRFSLFVDGEFVMGLRTDVMLASGLRKGDTVTPELIVRLRSQESLAEARELATRYAGRRRRTEEEVRRKLTGKEIPPDIAEMVIGSLKDSNVLDDRAYIRAFVHDSGLGKPAGSRLILTRLRGKGISEELLREVLPECLPAGEEAELAKRVAVSYADRLGRSRKQHTAVQIRALLFRYLSQRGFSGEARDRAVRSATARDAPEE